MDKESIFELQKIDCNCNDCVFMNRDQERFKQSQELHYKWQLSHFNITKDNLLLKAKEWDKRNEPDKAEYLRKEVSRMKFQFDKKEAFINYGYCTKLNKNVSFIPNVCQLDTQECFKHRKEWDY